MSKKTTKKEIKSADDVPEVVRLLTVIVGKPCWQIRFGYGDEIFIDIGDQISYCLVVNGVEFPKKKGEFIVASYGTDWILMKGGEIVTRSSESRDVINAKLSGLIGNLIVRIEVAFPKLTFTVFMEGDYALSITPQAEDDKIDLPYWQVFFTTTRRILEVGPGPVFTMIEKIQNLGSG